MIWRNPAAWLGLCTLLIPIAIHLLVRQQADRRPFPSLRFIQSSQLAAIRRRFITDWLLLVVRLAMLTLAVAALADPFWPSASRRAAWAGRIARAIVIDTSPSATANAPDVQQRVQRERAEAFRSATFEATTLADGIRRATDWLRRAPPASREIVVLSDFQLAALDAASVAEIPRHVGLRFVRTIAAPATRTADGRPQTWRPDLAGPIETRTPRTVVTAAETSTTWLSSSASTPAERARVAIATSGDAIAVEPFNVRLETNAIGRPFVTAAAQAVLATGVAIPARSDSRLTTIVFTNEGANAGDAARASMLPRDVVPLASPWMADVVDRIASDDDLERGMARAELAEDARTITAPWIAVRRDARGGPALLAAARRTNALNELVLVSRVSTSSEATALLVRATLRALGGADPLPEAEVATVSDATLAQWSRPASDPPLSEWQDVDGSDRRWLWVGVLAMLALEQLLRRWTRRTASPVDRTYEHAA